MDSLGSSWRAGCLCSLFLARPLLRSEAGLRAIRSVGMCGLSCEAALLGFGWGILAMSGRLTAARLRSLNSRPIMLFVLGNALGLLVFITAFIL
jgi:F0F1-type ATP synthase membrane subunit c/vacuolar-type H+-ATPase subunit K